MHAILQRLMLKRLKVNELADMPDKHDSIVFCKLSPLQVCGRLLGVPAARPCSSS